MTLLEMTLSRMDKAAAHLEDVVYLLNKRTQDRPELIHTLSAEGESLESLSELPEVKRLEKAFAELDTLLENQ